MDTDDMVNRNKRTLVALLFQLLETMDAALSDNMDLEEGSQRPLEVHS